MAWAGSNAVLGGGSGEKVRGTEGPQVRSKLGVRNVAAGKEPRAILRVWRGSGSIQGRKNQTR